MLKQSVKLNELASSINGLSPFHKYSRLLNEQHFYQNSIMLQWSERTVHPVTLRQLANFGKKLTKSKLISGANFVRTEIPTRLALKIKELQRLDMEVSNNFHLRQVYESYYHCFNSFRRMGSIDSLEENDQFCNFLSNVLDDHLLILPHLMMGALEVSMLKLLPQQQLDEFLSSMIRSRISRRLIMEQHISLSKSFLLQDKDTVERSPDFVGLVFQTISAHDHLKTLTEHTSNFLQTQYPDLKLPELIIIGEDVKFQFMKSHINYIFAEILRNALKSTIEQFLKINQHVPEEELKKMSPPPIIVEIINSKTDIYFKFSDQGGGIPHDRLSKIWSFGKNPERASNFLENFHKMPGLDLRPKFPILNHQFKSGPKPQKIPVLQTNHNDPLITDIMHNLGSIDDATTIEMEQSTLKSLVSRPFEYTLGVSLPMCKVYTDYWNGELDARSVEGYGTDVYLKINKLGTFSDHGKAQLDRA